MDACVSELCCSDLALHARRAGQAFFSETDFTEKCHFSKRRLFEGNGTGPALKFWSKSRKSLPQQPVNETWVLGTR